MNHDRIRHVVMNPKPLEASSHLQRRCLGMDWLMTVSVMPPARGSVGAPATFATRKILSLYEKHCVH